LKRSFFRLLGPLWVLCVSLLPCMCVRVSTAISTLRVPITRPFETAPSLPSKIADHSNSYFFMIWVAPLELNFLIAYYRFFHQFGPPPPSFRSKPSVPAPLHFPIYFSSLDFFPLLVFFRLSLLLRRGIAPPNVFPSVFCSS